jgi:phosphoenolpyruvate carboxylase
MKMALSRMLDGTTLMMRTLSDDVRLVIDTLGYVIRAQAGEAVFAAVEAVRLAAKQAREHESTAQGDEARTRLSEIVASLDAPTALEVARAFTLYFQLVNLAEDAQRTRELRRRETEGGPDSVRDSIHGALATLAQAGATREDALRALREVNLSFVFTAHPTEARRQTTERLLADIALVLRRRDRRALTSLEVAAADRRLRAAIEALFQHAAERLERPEVLDEVRAGLWYLRHVMLDSVPRFQRRLHHAFEQHFGAIDPASLPMPVGFGSWMGGDRDGNPFVTAEVMAQTLELHRDLVLERYAQDLAGLLDPLAGVAHRLSKHADLDAALDQAARILPGEAEAISARNPREPMRRLLAFMLKRIQRTRERGAGAYDGPSEFLADLTILRRTLQDAATVALPDDALLNLIHRVRSFGFHLAALDVREDSGVHREVVGELLGDPVYPSATPAQRRRKLNSLALPESGDRGLSPLAVRLLDLFRAIRDLQTQFGPQALGTYIISMTESATDVLEVLTLADLHGIGDALDIVPLLETPDDLASAGPLLEALFSDPVYAGHLARRQHTQELLVGYSDSMKQGGIMASRVGVAEAQRAAADVCRRHKIRLRVFHGRGGSVSRGGGPTHRAILALPPEAFSGEARITEQGEMRAHNFANPDLAVRYLEQSVGAAMQVRLDAASPRPSQPAAADTLSALAASSQRAYRALLEDPRLIPYFQSATPFEHITRLNIASRPSRRSGAPTGLSGLRAIPWVFSWSQSRHVLTGWFGVGTALSDLLGSPAGAARLREVYAGSRFLRDLIDNVAMALSKTDLPIASRYAALCHDPHERGLFDVIAAEYARTVSAVLSLTRQPELLADDAVLARSIRLRNPYVDPLSYIQIEALRRLRKDGMTTDDRALLERAALVTVQGIAAGIRHTG